MRKIFLLFGSEGNLGKGIQKVMISKEFEKLYFFDSKFTNAIDTVGKVTKIKTEDLRMEKNVSKAFSQIKWLKNREYHLFSTIGIFNAGKGIKEMELDEWQKSLDINLTIPFLLSKIFIKLVSSKSGKGSICFTGALSSNSIEENKANYIVSKNALNKFIDLLAAEARKYNVSANVIAPYIINTKENRSWVEDESDLISPKSIGELVYLMIKNYSIVSGNVIKLPWTLK